jgi:hypothetical protein
MSIDVPSNEGRNELIFSHEGNARVAASVILIGVVVALIGSLFMAIGPKFKQAPRQGGDASVGAASTSVRIVGQTPRDNVSCDQTGLAEFRPPLPCANGGHAEFGQSSVPRADQRTFTATRNPEHCSIVFTKRAEGKTGVLRATDGTAARFIQLRGFIGYGDDCVQR